LGSNDEVADVLHDAFVQIFASLGELREPRALKAWLTRIAVHTARRHIRTKRRRRWLSFLPFEELPEPVAPEVDPESSEALRATFAVLERLAVHDRVVFSLRFLEGFELTQVAEACDLSLATTKRHLIRARAAFVEQARDFPVLKPWLEEA
jgi:RNA polymerase sigma-70 factor, ECF subfamily